MHPGGDPGNMANIGMPGFIDLVGMRTAGKRGGTKRDIDDAFSLLTGTALCAENDTARQNANFTQRLKGRITLCDTHHHGQGNMANATRAGMALMGALLAWTAAVHAQSPQPPVVDMAPVVVSGAQPGPGLWRVSSSDGHTLWILGTVSPLPATLEWRSDEVDAVVAEAQQMLAAPGWTLDADIGFFKGLTLLPSAMKAARSPDGRRLQEVLPPALYARWEVQKKRYIGRDGGIEKDRPLVAATELYGAALKKVGLKQRSAVSEVLDKAAKAHGHTPVSTRLVIRIDDPRQALKDVRASSLDDVACFERTLDVVESKLPILVERANAWSVGDIDALQRMAVQSQYGACVDAVERSEFGRRRGLTDLDRRAQEKWLGHARDALKRNTVTFAVVPVFSLLAPGGYLDELRRSGYEVENP